MSLAIAATVWNSGAGVICQAAPNQANSHTNKPKLLKNGVFRGQKLADGALVNEAKAGEKKIFL
jgi:hypothetical protein